MSDWSAFVADVRAERGVAVERTLARLAGLVSYERMDRAELRASLDARFSTVLDGLEARRPPGRAADDATSIAHGERRAREGVTFADLLTGWRLGGDALYRVARDRVPAGPGRDGLLLEFLELSMAWIEHAAAAMEIGHRRGELARARELHHVQGTLVRRVLAGVVTPGELRAGLAPLGLDPDRPFHAVHAKPTARMGLVELDRHLGVDGLGRAGNGLATSVDGELRGFVAVLPRVAAPAAIGVSEPASLLAFAGPSRRAGRALRTALALGAEGTFDFASVAGQAAVLADPDVTAVLHARYVAVLEAVPGGPALLDTAERHLAESGRVDVVAQALGIHPNTVRHRLARFEELTGRSLRDVDCAVELWWALQARRLGEPGP